MRRPARLLVAATVTNIGLLVAASILLWTRPESQWPNSLLAYLPQPVWLVLPGVMLLCSLLAGRRWLVAVNALSVCFAAVALSSFSCATGSPGEPGTEAIPVRVVTWNVHNEYQSADEITSVLLLLKPDIVCLQEAWNDSFDLSMPGFSAISKPPMRIYSKFPVAGHRKLHLSSKYRDWMQAEVTIGDRDVSVFNIHVMPAAYPHSLRRDRRDPQGYLHYVVGRREKQLEYIRDALPATQPVIVAGDFNTPPGSKLWGIINGRLTDAFAATRFGPGLTYLLRKQLPSWRIDYVWCGNGVRPVYCSVGDAEPSDHRPVIADILVPKQAAASAPANAATD